MYRIGIVAHNQRADAAHALQETVGATFMHMDNGTKGCESSHRRVWEWLDSYAERNKSEQYEWAVVLEDDAQPVVGFTQQLKQALTVAPTPIVSLYLGTNYPIHWQPRISLAKSNANTVNAAWMVTHHLLHAVGVAIRTDLLPSMLTEAQYKMPIDEAITAWAQAHGHRVGYTWPSLVDHDDGPPLIGKRADGDTRTQPRKAWWCHTRTEWTDKAVTL